MGPRAGGTLGDGDGFGAIEKVAAAAAAAAAAPDGLGDDGMDGAPDPWQPDDEKSLLPGAGPMAGETAAPKAKAEPRKLVSWQTMGEALGPVSWAWERWLPNGFLTLLAGRTGLGKSALALRIAGCFLAGWAWPDGTPFEGERGAVLWIEAEAAQMLNLQRARDWGLPLDLIFAPLADALDDVALDDKKHRAFIQDAAARDEVKLIILDSLSGANGGKRDENSAGMLQLGKWLGELAKRTGKPLLVTHHLRKHNLLDEQAPALEKLRGSGAIPQISRCVWMLDQPDNLHIDLLRLCVVKSNLAKFPGPVGTHFQDDGVLVFDDVAPQEKAKLTATAEAALWLKELLAEGGMSQALIEIAAKQNGYSWATVRKAKSRANITSRKQPGAKGGWEWSL